MAIHPSVIKRHRQSLKRRARNQEITSKLRTLIKKVRLAVEARDQENAPIRLREVNRAVRKAVSKGVLKPNTASRWVSRLARSVHLLAAHT
ncbi:MAG: 30S ribosomal protein S20 [Candidatus Binatia bacterium]